MAGPGETYLQRRAAGLVEQQGPAVVQSRPTRSLHGQDQLSGWLPPAPVLPLVRSLPTADELVPVVGEDLVAPLRVLEDGVARAEAAVTELRKHRPAGLLWNQSVAQDAEDAAAGTPPKQWRLQKVLAGDAARWATAMAAVKAIGLLVSTAKAELNMVKLASTAGLVAEAKANKWAEESLVGWQNRSELVTATAHYRAAEAALAEYQAANRVQTWANGQAWSTRSVDDEPGAVPPVTRSLPGDRSKKADRERIGTWLALGLVVDPHQVWLRLPSQEAIWPTGAEQLLVEALPESGKRFAGLRDRGVHEVDR